jgi:hypothetical protein
MSGPGPGPVEKLQALDMVEKEIIACLTSAGGNKTYTYIIFLTSDSVTMNSKIEMLIILNLQHIVTWAVVPRSSPG